MDSETFFNILLSLSIAGNVVLCYLVWQYDKTCEMAHKLILELLGQEINKAIALQEKERNGSH